MNLNKLILLKMLFLLGIIFPPQIAFGKFTFKSIDEIHILQLKKASPWLFRGTSSLSKSDILIRSLMTTNSYEMIRAYRSSSEDIKLVGDPLRILSAVTIEGHHLTSTSVLLSVLNLEVGKKFQKNSIFKAANKLKEYYGERGFFQAEITGSFKILPSGKASIHFSIIEGPPCQITEILIHSPNNALNKRLLVKIKRYRRSIFSRETINQIRSISKKYFQTQRFLLSEIQLKEEIYNDDRTQVKLIFKIESPLKFDISFSGYTNLTLPDIRRASKISSLDSTHRKPAHLLTQNLFNHYINLGYTHVKITYKELKTSDPYFKRIKIQINEGPRVKIDTLIVAGRISRPSKYYETFIIDHSSDQIQKGYYNSEELKIGYKNLVTDLINQGFLRASIRSSRTEYSQNKSLAIVSVHLEEGPLTYVSKIKFKGNSHFQNSQLLETIPIKVNSPLLQKDILLSLKALENFYKSHSFLEMHITNKKLNLITYNKAGTQAYLTFHISEGPQIRIADIRIRGNSFTKTYVIKREIDLEVGDLLTPERMAESKTRLDKLGLFGRVEINTLEIGSDIADRTLMVNVEERKPGLSRTGIGMNNERDLTVRGFTSLSYNNIAGTARGVSGRVELQENIAHVEFLEQKIILGYLEPFLFDSLYKGRINIIRSLQVTDFTTNPKIIFLQESHKIEFVTERDFTSHLKFDWTLWSIDSSRVFQEPKTPQITPPSTQNIVLIGPTITWDHRDSPFLPTKGFFSRWDLNYSTPDLGSSELIHFARSQATTTYYLPFGDTQVIWANSLQAGYLVNLSDRTGSGVPTSHAFRLGGLTTIRGFGGASGSDKIPTDSELGINEGSLNELIIKNNSRFYLLKSELRFPISGNLGGVVFYDGGEVAVSGKTFPKPYRQSVGVGLRYNTPLGPVSIDFARKIDTLPGEEKSRVHFSIGTF